MKYTGRILATIFMILSQLGSLWYASSGSEFVHESLFIVISSFVINCLIGWWLGRVYDRSKFYSELDSLTSAYNRSFFIKKVAKRLLHAEKNNREMSMICLDLNRFKMINDSWGHMVGDQIIQEFAQRLKSCIDRSHMISRSAGDEFFILLDPATQQETEDVIDTVVEKMSEPFVIKQQEFHVSASIGVSMYPKDADNLEELIKYADTAMYIAKKNKSGTYQFYTKDLGQMFPKKLNMEKEIRKALKLGHFSLHYQPKIDLKTQKLMGMESLIRWEHPDAGFIPPNKFIPLAEELDLILPIGDFVLETACEQQQKWNKLFKEPLYVSVNLSPRQLVQVDFAEKVQRIIEKYEIDPKCLVLEITENITIYHDKAILSRIQELKNLGVRLAIDDFGTGYASISYLTKIPADMLKIDRSFIQQIQSPHDTSTIVDSICKMGKNLGMLVVAEGIESMQQLQFLQNKCEAGQGYYFSRPMNAVDFQAKYFEKKKAAGDLEGS